MPNASHDSSDIRSDELSTAEDDISSATDEFMAAVDTLVFAALELSADRRAAYLDGLDDVAPEVVQKARATLDAIAAMPESFLQEPAIAIDAHGAGEDVAGDETAPAPATSLLGQKIGRFLLMEHIGTGAMGDVFSAYDEQLDRKVAVKLVKSRAGSPATSDQLLREARTLAQVSHPNVVPVYEAGQFRGRVYLAMEFVRGLTLRTWQEQHVADAGERSWRPILDKYLASAQGLLAAHRAGLVHRDFKPDNVLVGDDGRVRVADFGQARGQMDDLSESGQGPRIDPLPASVATTFTRTGYVMGTPAYMSPEQWRAERVDARSDQFSFCVALYESLYGQRPFEADNQLHLASLATRGAYRAPPRRTPVPRHLWVIIERGLAPDPADRYPDMGELIEALARDPHRHRRRLATGAALGAIVAASVFATTRISSPGATDPCAASGQQIGTLWNADIRATIADAFRATGLPYADETWSRADRSIDEYTRSLRAERLAACQATHVRHEQSEEVLELRNLCLDRGQRDLSALLGRLTSADTALVEYSGEAVTALPDPRRCADREALVLGVRPPATPELVAEVTEIREQLAQAQVLYQARQFDSAATIAEPQLRRARSLDYRPVRAEAAYLLGVVYRERAQGDDVEQAQALLLDAADHAEHSRHDELAARTWNALTRHAGTHHANMTQGHLWSRRALAAIGRTGSDPSLMALALNRLGWLYHRDESLAEAEETLRQGLELAQRHSDIDDAIEADLWHYLGNVLLDTRRTDEARAAYDTALRMAREVHGPSHPRVVILERVIGSFLIDTGAYDRARERLHWVRDQLVALRGDDHLDIGYTLLELARLELGAGSLDRAEQLMARARAIYEQRLPAGDKELARLYSSLGLIQYKRGRYGSALRSFQRAETILLATLGHDSTEAGINYANVTKALLKLSREDRAWQYIAEVEKRLEPDGRPHERWHFLADYLRAMTRFHQDRFAEAIPHLQRANNWLQGRAERASERAEVTWMLDYAHKAISTSERTATPE